MEYFVGCRCLRIKVITHSWFLSCLQHPATYIYIYIYIYTSLVCVRVRERVCVRACMCVRDVNVSKGHTLLLLDKSMPFGTDDLYMYQSTILIRNLYESKRCV